MSDNKDISWKFFDLFRKLKSSSGGNKNFGWIFGLLAAGIGMLLIGMFTFRAFRQGKKLAKLQHEKDVAEEMKQQAKVQSDINIIDEKIKSIDRSLQEAKETYNEAIDSIDAIKTWDDWDNTYG